MSTVDALLGGAVGATLNLALQKSSRDDVKQASQAINEIRNQLGEHNVVTSGVVESLRELKDGLMNLQTSLTAAVSSATTAQNALRSFEENPQAEAHIYAAGDGQQITAGSVSTLISQAAESLTAVLATLNNVIVELSSMTSTTTSTSEMTIADRLAAIEQQLASLSGAISQLSGGTTTQTVAGDDELGAGTTESGGTVVTAGGSMAMPAATASFVTGVVYVTGSANRYYGFTSATKMMQQMINNNAPDLKHPDQRIILIVCDEGCGRCGTLRRATLPAIAGSLPRNVKIIYGEAEHLSSYTSDYPFVMEGKKHKVNPVLSSSGLAYTLNYPFIVMIERDPSDNSKLLYKVGSHLLYSKKKWSDWAAAFTKTYRMSGSGRLMSGWTATEVTRTL